MAKETITIDGTMYWNECAREATYLGKGTNKFKFELSNLSDDVVELINKFAPDHTIKSKDTQPERGNYVTVTQSMNFTPYRCLNGEQYMPFKNENKVDMTKDEVSTIGNGSVVRVTFSSYGSGRLSFEGGTVLKMIPYIAEPVDEEPTVVNNAIPDELEDSIPF